MAELNPIKIFHEPIKIRAENVARIEAQAAEVGVHLRTEVFATRESWQDYTVNTLHAASEPAMELGLALHALSPWRGKVAREEEEEVEAKKRCCLTACE